MLTNLLLYTAHYNGAMPCSQVCSSWTLSLCHFTSGQVSIPPVCLPSKHALYTNHYQIKSLINDCTIPCPKLQLPSSLSYTPPDRLLTYTSIKSTHRSALPIPPNQRHVPSIRGSTVASNHHQSSASQLVTAMYSV